MTPDEYIETALRDLSDVYGAATVLAHARNLFEDPVGSSPSRTTDPATSHASGARNATRDVARFSEASIQGKVLTLFATNSAGFTALEAAYAAVHPASLHRVESARKRVSDLIRAGYLRATEEVRTNRGSNDPSNVLVLTEEGSVAFAKMTRTGWTRGR